MTRKEILQATHANFSKFLRLWRDHKREQGLGALVFTSEEDSADEDEMRCEFWTLSELRHHIRRMNECDEVVYTWLKEGERDGGYPIVIFSPGCQPGCEQLDFSRVKKAHLS